MRLLRVFATGPTKRIRSLDPGLFADTTNAKVYIYFYHLLKVVK